MDRIESMGVFAKVIEKQSFSGAARELRLSQAVMSKHVGALEDWFGALLLNRTMRRPNVTEMGAPVYQRCELILDEIDVVQQSTSALQTSPRGVLHLVAPVPFGITSSDLCLPTISGAVPRSWSTSRWIGFDLALRVGELKDSSLVVRRVAPVRFVLCASPDYVKQHGVPREPADLSNHRCLFYSLRAIPGEWRFKGPFPLQQRQYASCRDARGRTYRLRSDFCCGPESCGRSLDLANARLSTG